jgi:hypothetical protein
MAHLKDRLQELVDREHKYHTSDYDGVVGVTDEDLAQIQKDLLELVDLLDKNGVEIYEGDIVEQDDGKEVFRFAVEWKDNHFTLGYNIGTREVIGNIYESPDLLTKSLEDK